MLGKKALVSSLVRNTAGPPGQDFTIQNRLDRLRDVATEPKKRKNNNKNFSPPPSPPLVLVRSYHHLQPRPLNLHFQFCNSFQPPPPRFDNYFGNFHIPAQQGLSENIFGSQTEILTIEKDQEKVVQDRVQQELGNTIYQLPNPPKLELGDGFLNLLGVEADDILEQKHINKKQEKDAVLEQIKEDYNFDNIKDTFYDSAVPHQLDFFYNGENSNFNKAIEYLSPSNENREFIAF